MDDNLELLIRSEYSKKNPEFESLALWVNNSFSELCFHITPIYDFQTRVKNINSLIDKVDFKIEEGDGFSSFDDVCIKIKDLVASRIIVLEPGSLKYIHGIICGMDRVEINGIRIHFYDAAAPQRIIRDIKKNSPVEVELRPNNTGYFGIHYILSPMPTDQFYRLDGISIYNKFELQVRTVMFHAWSEIQHKAIYKAGERNYKKQNLLGQFASLANSIAACDHSLEGLAKEGMAYSSTYQVVDVHSGEYLKLVEEIKKIISSYEEDRVNMKIRYSDTEEFIGHNKDLVDKLLKNKKNNLTELGYLAELFLKSGMVNEACEEYEYLLGKTDFDEWITLRYAEALQSKGDKKKLPAVLKNLEKKIKQNKTKKDAYLLATGAALAAWIEGEYSMAKDLGYISIEINDKDITWKMRVKMVLNYVYYTIDYAESIYDKATEKKNICNELEEVYPLIEEVLSIKDKLVEIDFVSSRYDTLAWYFYKRYEYCGSGDTPEGGNGNDDLEQASKYIDKCFHVWSTLERDLYETQDDWMFHSKVISNAVNDLKMFPS